LTRNYRYTICTKTTSRCSESYNYKNNFNSHLAHCILSFADIIADYKIQRAKFSFPIQSGVLRTSCASRSAQSIALATGVRYFYFDDG